MNFVPEESSKYPLYCNIQFSKHIPSHGVIVVIALIMRMNPSYPLSPHPQPASRVHPWAQGRLALSKQSSRFELPMDMKLLESKFTVLHLPLSHSTNMYVQARVEVEAHSFCGRLWDFSSLQHLGDISLYHEDDVVTLQEIIREKHLSLYTTQTA